MKTVVYVMLYDIMFSSVLLFGDSGSAGQMHIKVFILMI